MSALGFRFPCVVPYRLCTLDSFDSSSGATPADILMASIAFKPSHTLTVSSISMACWWDSNPCHSVWQIGTLTVKVTMAWRKASPEFLPSYCQKKTTRNKRCPSTEGVVSYWVAYCTHCGAMKENTVYVPFGIYSEKYNGDTLVSVV